MARPTIITPASRAAIAKGLARGATYREVSAASGVSKGTLENWLGRANRADQRRRERKTVAERERPFLQLYDDMRDAEADAEFDALQQIVQHLQIGVDLVTAAAAAGVPQKMIDRIHDRAVQAMSRYEDDERLDAEQLAYLELLRGFEQGRARQKVSMMAAITKAGMSDWHASAWWLERNYPDEFASPNKRRQSGTTAAGGRPLGSSSAPDRPSTADPAPPRIRLRQVGG